METFDFLVSGKVGNQLDNAYGTRIIKPVTVTKRPPMFGARSGADYYA